MKKHLPIIVGSLGVSILTVAGVLVFVPEQEATPLDGIHFSAPSVNAAALAKDEILGAENVRYQSDTFNYSLRYPSTWNLDDSRSTTSSDVLYGPNKDVIVRINTTPLTDVHNSEELYAKAEIMRENMSNDPSFTLGTFKQLSWNEYPAIRAEGTRKTETKEWKVISVSVFRLDKEDVFTMMFTLEASKETSHKAAIEAVISSVNLE